MQVICYTVRCEVCSAHMKVVVPVRLIWDQEAEQVEWLEVSHLPQGGDRRVIYARIVQGFLEIYSGHLCSHFDDNHRIKRQIQYISYEV
jgi:hypothetical protein